MEKGCGVGLLAAHVARGATTALQILGSKTFQRVATEGTTAVRRFLRLFYRGSLFLCFHSARGVFSVLKVPVVFLLFFMVPAVL